MYAVITRDNEPARHYWSKNLTHILRLYSSDKKLAFTVRGTGENRFEIYFEGKVYASGMIMNNLSF